MATGLIWLKNEDVVAKQVLTGAEAMVVGQRQLVLKSGKSHKSKFWTVTINADGHPVINGIVMTDFNSSLVDDGAYGVTRILNSLIKGTQTLRGDNVTKLNIGGVFYSLALSH